MVDTEVISSPSESHPNTKRRIFLLEPALLFSLLGSSLSGTVFQNQLIYQTCTAILRYNETDCGILGTDDPTPESQKIEAEVQPYAANILMARTLFEGIVPAVISLFIGPWSDKFGRKPVIVAVFVGNVLVHGLSSLIAFFSTLYLVNPWYYLLPIVPISLMGGTCALITGIFCYIADVTSAKDTPFRMALMEASFFVGSLAGSLSSSYVLKATNAWTVFLISSVLNVVSLIYILFAVEESVRIEQLNSSSKVRGLFRWELVRDMFKTCFKRRPNYDRAIIWLTITSLALSIFIMVGSGNVFFLFVREKFEWTVKDITFYDSLGTLIHIFGNIIGMIFLQKYLGLSVISLALLGYASNVLDVLIKSIAIYPWHLFLSLSMSLLKGITGPMCRAILTSVVPQTEIGKVLSLTTSLESITPLASSPLYTFVYSSSLKTNPGAFNFISTGLFFLCYVLLAIVYYIDKIVPRVAYASINA